MRKQQPLFSGFLLYTTILTLVAGAVVADDDDGLNTWDCDLMVPTHCKVLDMNAPGRRNVQGIPDSSTDISGSTSNKNHVSCPFARSLGNFDEISDQSITNC